MSKKLIYLTFPLLLLAGVYFLGPAPAKPKWNSEMPAVPQGANQLEAYVAAQERKHTLKSDNEARIVWADSLKQKTKVSVVYLHGFSASQEEGDPIHTGFAKTFGCNLYLARLADHGIDTTEQLLYFSPDRLWQSTKEALAIGKALGEQVIVMSTSTGGTMALILAAEYPQDVFGLVNLSPNVAINDPTAWLLNDPWGLQIARKVLGSNYREDPKPDSLIGAYWNQKYRIEALTQLQELTEDKMVPATFQKVKCPSLTLYYFKNEKEQDPTVKVSAILKMNEQLGTPSELKELVAVPNAGAHVLGSHLVSKDIPTVRQAIENFAINKLKMEKIN